MKSVTKSIFTALVCSVMAVSASAADVSWYVEDGADVGSLAWSDTAIGAYWEYMYAALPEDDVCTFADLPWPPPDDVAYHACTPNLTADYSGYDFWAELWLANNYADHSNPVTVELWRGAPAAPGTLLKQVAITVTNFPDAARYNAVFGTIDPLVLNDEALILKIIYGGAPGDTHIYWDSLNCPTGLFGEMVVTPVERTSWSRIKSVCR